MALFILRRMLLSLVIVTLVVFVLFVLSRLLSGDPVTLALGSRATAEMRAAFVTNMGLDQPVYTQFLVYIGALLRGELGVDIISGRPVSTMLSETVPHTLILASVSITWAAVAGILIGVQSATSPGSAFDRISGIISVGFIALPPFVMAIYLLIFGALVLQIFPAAGLGDGMLGYAHHLILPSLAVGLAWAGYIARIIRAGLIEEMAADHVRMAIAYGVPSRRINGRHALRIAIVPVITLIAGGIGFLISSAVFAEIVFSRPGLGMLIFNAVQSRNYPVLQGGVLLSAVIFVIIALLADIVIALIDPRSRTRDQ